MARRGTRQSAHECRSGSVVPVAARPIGGVELSVRPVLRSCEGLVQIGQRLIPAPPMG
jgi:hypothetical protein